MDSLASGPIRLALSPRGAPCLSDVHRPVVVLSHDRDDDLHHVEHHEHRQRERSLERTPADHQGPKLVSPPEPTERRGRFALFGGFKCRQTRSQPLGMGHRGLGRADDARSGEASPPAEFDIVAHRQIANVESAEQAEEVISDQGDASRRNKDVSHCIVLALIHLPGLNLLDDRAIAINPLANVEQNPPVVHRDHLGCDDPRVRTKCLLNEEMHGVRVEVHIVMAEQEE